MCQCLPHWDTGGQLQRRSQQKKGLANWGKNIFEGISGKKSDTATFSAAKQTRSLFNFFFRARGNGGRWRRVGSSSFAFYCRGSAFCHRRPRRDQQNLEKRGEKKKQQPGTKTGKKKKLSEIQEEELPKKILHAPAFRFRFQERCLVVSQKRKFTLGSSLPRWSDLRA